MWLYEDKEFVADDEFLKDFVGFVYLVTEESTGKKYLGKKLFWKPKTLPVTKTRLKKIKTKVQSDWMKYYGSNEELKALVKESGGKGYSREILRLCKSKGDCSYYEAKYQFQYGVLESDEYYNRFIGCKIHAAHLSVNMKPKVAKKKK